MLKAFTASVVIAASGALGCPADCDQDGELTVLDFVCFQGLFLSGDDAADMNGDGILNILDFVAYQAAFKAGCPDVVDVTVTGFAYDGNDGVNPATILYVYDETNADVFQPDDVIISYRGIPVPTGEVLHGVIQDLPDVEPGDVVDMVVMRDGEELLIHPTAFLLQLPPADAPPSKTEREKDDRDCVTTNATPNKEVCRCVALDNPATICIITYFRNASEDGAGAIIRTKCTDTDMVSCDSDDLNKDNGK